ncbi:MAG: hypothetical protein H6737_21370 [Alphaproteobacteria bacterium]|nr:hypothetical protein [Alphaproteobacteria bacterium]
MIAMYTMFLTGCSDSSLWADATGNPPIQETGIDLGDDTGEGDSGDSGGGEGPWVGQWGEVDQAGGQAYTGFVDWDGTVAQCEVEYPLSGGTAAQGCPSCTVALAFTYGTPEIVTNVGGRCEQLGWTGLEGSPLVVGHQDPGMLWQQVGGTWSQNGWSSVSGTTWGFEIEL